jgi:hypothetical protein
MKICTCHSWSLSKQCLISTIWGIYSNSSSRCTQADLILHRSANLWGRESRMIHNCSRLCGHAKTLLTWSRLKKLQHLTSYYSLFLISAESLKMKCKKFLPNIWLIFTHKTKTFNWNTWMSFLRSKLSIITWPTKWKHGHWKNWFRPLKKITWKDTANSTDLAV